MKTEQQWVVLASGHFLCDLLPDNYDELEDHEVYQFCMDNAWEPFEYWCGKELFEVILSAGWASYRFAADE
jgi:hypothetical protein